MGGPKGPTVHDAITEDLALGRAEDTAQECVTSRVPTGDRGFVIPAPQRSLDCPKLLPECIDNPNRK